MPQKNISECLNNCMRILFYFFNEIILSVINHILISFYVIMRFTTVVAHLLVTIV